MADKKLVELKMEDMGELVDFQVNFNGIIAIIILIINCYMGIQTQIYLFMFQIMIKQTCLTGYLTAPNF